MNLNSPNPWKVQTTVLDSPFMDNLGSHKKQLANWLPLPTMSERKRLASTWDKTGFKSTVSCNADNARLPVRPGTIKQQKVLIPHHPPWSWYLSLLILIKCHFYNHVCRCHFCLPPAVQWRKGGLQWPADNVVPTQLLELVLTQGGFPCKSNPWCNITSTSDVKLPYWWS